MNKLICLALLFISFHLCADEKMSADELEKWFNEDEDTSTEQVNEGELKFLLEAPNKTVLHSINTLSISQQSLKNGWVLLEQCYKNLDPVPVAEISYRYKAIRDLNIISTENIESAFTEGQSVQLTDITKNASLCIKAKVQIFYKNPDGTFSLINGPFHRRFLDGYYPYHITLNINYPSSLLKFIQSKPRAQAGFEIRKSRNLIVIDSYFEGMLYTEIIFKPIH